MGDSKTVVLVHGAWHGAWCWEKVVPVLESNGVPAIAVELPLTSLSDDIDATRRALDDVPAGGAVLCGHSYGGMVVTGAGHHPAADHLVFLTAFACDEGESPAATAVGVDLPATDLLNALQISDDGTIVSITPDGAVKGFYHDCDQADVDAALARLRPMRFECLTTPSGPPAW